MRYTIIIPAIVLAGCSSPLLSSSLQADDWDAPPIRYSTTEPDNVVSRLQQKLDDREVKLPYENHFGYLRAVLAELAVPLSSQTLVFSKTSLQRNRIAPETPRSLFFNDDVYIGMCQEGEVLEISAVDPQLGTVFYTIDQIESERPQFVRQIDNCTLCHGSSHTQGIPGHLVRSVYTDAAGYPLLAEGTFRIDHTSPLKNRWGGWYVTGTHGRITHLGNHIFKAHHVDEQREDGTGWNVTSLADRIDLSGYLSPHSDLVALMVLEHQTEGHNRIARANFLTRQALHYEHELNRELGEQAGHRWEGTNSRIRAACEPLVQYLLMCDEAPLDAPLAGTSNFAADFTALGPHDAQGRSLRELDLQRRLFRYPLSYLIYSTSFDALPAEARDYVYRRLWEVLGGTDADRKFAHLTAADRRAIVEILRATKQQLPANWNLAVIK